MTININTKNAISRNAQKKIVKTRLLSRTTNGFFIFKQRHIKYAIICRIIIKNDHVSRFTNHPHTPPKDNTHIFGCNIIRNKIEGHYGRYWIAVAIFNLDHPIVRKAMSQLLYETRDAKMHLKCMRTIQISYIDCRGQISTRFYKKSVAYNFFLNLFEFKF